MSALAEHPDVVVDARDVAWKDGKPVRVRLNGDWLKVTATARPYRYRSRSADDKTWDRGVHAFKERARRDMFMQRDIAWGYIVQPYEMTEDGPLHGLVLKSRRSMLHRAARWRYDYKRHTTHDGDGKTWCVEHGLDGCGQDAVAEYEQYGEWSYREDPFRLGWRPYSLLTDRPDPPKEVTGPLGKMTIYGQFRSPRYAKYHPPPGA